MIILLVLLVLALSGVGWWNYAPTTKNVEPTGPATTRAIRRDFSSTVLATGAVKSQVGSEVKVGARISGKVIRLYANIGDFVKKDQVIAELEKEDLTARVERNKAELAVAEARIEDVQARLKLAEVQLQRHKELIVSRAVSQDALDIAAKELAVNEAGLRRVLGARCRDIRVQFLIESVLLAGTGGATGVLVGIGCAYGLSALGYWETLISWPSTAMAFGFSAILGVFFGMYPASRTAGLEPIEALRAE